jgi:transcription termination factor NusB
MMFSSEREALRKLGDEARSAIAQAKGLIAFAAQAAKSRKHRPDDDDNEFFRQLQQSVQDASQDLDSALNEAGQTLDAATAASLTGGTDTVSMVESTTLMVQMSVEVSVTANIVI